MAFALTASPASAKQHHTFVARFGDLDREAAERLSPPFPHTRFYMLRALRAAIEAAAQHFVPGRQGSVLIDIGCGSQPYRPLLAPCVGRYIGIDLPGNPVAAIHADASQSSALRASCADLVLSTQVLEHVPDPLAYLGECERIVKDDGFVLLTTHGYWRFHPDPVDYWRWTGHGLEQLCRAAGLHVVERRGVMGIMASGAHLMQDGLLPRVPANIRPAFVAAMQVLVALCDRLQSEQERRDDAAVFVIVARKTRRPPGPAASDCSSQDSPQ